MFGIGLGSNDDSEFFEEGLFSEFFVEELFSEFFDKFDNEGLKSIFEDFDEFDEFELDF